MAALFFDSGIFTRSMDATVVVIIEDASPRTLARTATFSTNGPGWWQETSSAATLVALDFPLSDYVLALHKALAARPRSKSGRLCRTRGDGRIAYAPCWNLQKSTRPPRGFEADATYKAKVMAELLHVRAKRH